MTAFHHSSDLLWLAGVQCAQVGVLFVGVWCVCRWLLADRPYLAHGLWVLLLIKCVTPPVWSSEVGVFSWVLHQPMDGVPAGAAIEPMGVIVNDPRLIREMKGQSSAMPEAASATGAISDGVMNSRLDVGFRDVQEPRVRWTLVILLIWAVGAVIIFTTTLGRFLSYRRKIWKSAIAHNEMWDEHLDAMRRRLGVRRRVRLVVTQEPMGPAVFGLLRPTIVLPQEIIGSRGPSELEPILAHELIHVRRGDLWIGLLQLIAGSAWWFYPPVWIAIRRVSRSSEACCDLAVVDALPHARRAYADLLLDVLARGQELRAIPLVPGMKAGDITSRRMEWIMTMRPKPGRWAVCLRWVLLIGLGVVVLPGAASDGKVGGSQQKIVPVQAAKGVEEDRIAVDGDADGMMLTTVYVLTKVYPQFARAGINRKGGQGIIQELVSSQLFQFPSVDITELRRADGSKEGSQGSDDVHPMLKSTIRFKGDSMFLYAPRSTHERVSQLLSALARTGLDQFRVKVEFGEIQATRIEDISNWKLAGKTQGIKVTEGANTLECEYSTPHVMEYTVMDASAWDVKKDSQRSVEPVFAPEWSMEASVFNCQSAQRCDVVRIPFVLPNAKKIWVVSEGIESFVHVRHSTGETKRGSSSHSDSSTDDSSWIQLSFGFSYSSTDSSSELTLTDVGGRTYDARVAGREIFELEIPIRIGKTVVVRVRDEHRWVEEEVIAVTVEHVPTQIWQRVGTDEFRIEPAGVRIDPPEIIVE